jgi:cytochrome d ubiquinol oxidase subunit I
MALILAFLASLVQIPLGHFHAVQVAETQPAKLAAFEGLWETQTNAPLLVMGLPNEEQRRTDFAIELPGVLSIGVGGTTETEVAGLNDFPEDEWPPLLLSFFSFHFMVGFGFIFIGFTALGLFLLWRQKLHENRLFLWAALLSIPLPVIANELGWIAAEVGRQPWIVYGLMRTDEAFSAVVPAGQILASIIMFTMIYTLLFCVWIFLLRRKLLKGPESEVPIGIAGEEASA